MNLYLVASIAVCQFIFMYTSIKFGKECQPTKIGMLAYCASQICVVIGGLWILHDIAKTIAGA